jgi:hypothetical protein
MATTAIPMPRVKHGKPLIGLKTIKIGAREAVELAGDNVAQPGFIAVPIWAICRLRWRPGGTGAKPTGCVCARDAPNKIPRGTVCAIVPTKRAAARAPPDPAPTEWLRYAVGSPGRPWATYFIPLEEASGRARRRSASA